MTRPTKEQVELALHRATVSVANEWVKADGSDGTVDGILAAEVLALREELDLSERDRKNVRASVAHACAEADKRVDAACAALNRARSIIARAEALPEQWRKTAEHDGDGWHDGMDAHQCAASLEAALKGEP